MSSSVIHVLRETRLKRVHHNKNSVIVAAIVRITYVTSVDITDDITGTMALTVFLAAFEPNLAIICACIPMLRPLWAKFRGYVSTRRHSTALTDGEDASGGSKFGRGNELKNISSSGHRSTGQRSAGATQGGRRLRTSQGADPWQTASSQPGGREEDEGGAVGVSFGVTAPLEAAHTLDRGKNAVAADYDEASLGSGSEGNLVPGLRAPPAKTRPGPKSRWAISR